MKNRVSYIISCVIAAILCVVFSCVAFATSEEKEYIVFPKTSEIEELGTENISDGGFLVVDESELDSLLDSGNQDCICAYAQNSRSFLSSNSLSGTGAS